MRTLPDNATVKYQHYRLTPDHNLMPAHLCRALRLPMRSQGGLTIATLAWEGHIIVAQAECNDRDNFSKSIGRNIARGRAIKKLYEEVMYK